MVLVVSLRGHDGKLGATNHPELGDMPTGAVVPVTWAALYDFHALNGRTGAQSELSLAVAAEKDPHNACCYMLGHLASWARQFPAFVWTVGSLTLKGIPE